MTRAIAFSLSLLCTVLCVNAQDEMESKPYRFGGYAAGSLNHHVASFAALPSVPNCCVEFKGNDALRSAAGALVDFRVSQLLDGEFRAGYSNASTVLREENFIGNAIIGNDAIPAYTAHTIDATLHAIDIAAFIRYRLRSEIPLRFYGGILLSILFSARYEQKETLERPMGITFSNGLTTRNEFSGVIPSLNSVQPALVIGSAWPLRLSSTIEIAPEIFYHYPFRSLVDGIDWRAHQLRLGIAMRFESGPIIPAAEPVPIAHDEPAPAKFFKLEMRTSGVRNDGTIDTTLRIAIDEVDYIELYPLLPYVFFPEGSAELSQTRLHLLKKDDVSAFDERILRPNTMDVYSDMLNVIGARLAMRRRSSITIVGCNNTLGAEQNNLRLSEHRAMAVKQYFENVWGIEPARVNVKWQNLPSMPTRNDAIDGQVENRRAEIKSDDFEILGPVRIEETKRLLSIGSVQFKPFSESSAPVHQWNLRVEQSGNALFQRSGGALPQVIEWQPAASVRNLTSDSIRTTIVAVNDDERSATATASLPVEIHKTNTRRFERLNNVRIERYGLILFDFDLAAITRLNGRILDSVRARISPTSRVTIEGFADRTGTKEHNKSLALMRCQSVRTYLGASVRDDQIEMKPVGSDELIFYNELPEGRNYNRIVYITIETPE